MASQLPATATTAPRVAAGAVLLEVLPEELKDKAVQPDGVTCVLYHGSGCSDGFAAAWAAWACLGDKATYHALDHAPGVAPPPEASAPGASVVVLDYCFNSATTARLIAGAEGRALVLDHHASAQKELAGVDARNQHFQMLMSGATLSWCYFHPGEPVPLWLRYVEDRDIWRWALRDSEAFSAAFSMVPQTFEAFAALHAGGEAAVDALIAEGRAVVAYRNTVRDSHVKRSVAVALRAAPQWRCGIVNCSTLTSEVGNAICTATGAHFAAMWSYDHAKRSYYVSLRSNSDEVDVSVLAKAFGGGGHKRAAGFSWEGKSIEELIDPTATVAPPSAVA